LDQTEAAQKYVGGLMFNALSTRKRLLATTVLCGAIAPLAMAMPAFAQTAPAAEEAAQVEEIVVTGSRIARPDLVSSSPVATVGEKDLV